MTENLQDSGNERQARRGQNGPLAGPAGGEGLGAPSAGVWLLGVSSGRKRRRTSPPQRAQKPVIPRVTRAAAITHSCQRLRTVSVSTLPRLARQCLTWYARAPCDRGLAR